MPNLLNEKLTTWFCVRQICGSNGYMDLFDCKRIHNFKLILFGEHQVQTVNPPVAFGNIDGSGETEVQIFFSE